MTSRKAFFTPHIGWILFKLKPDARADNVTDLQQDRLVMWQQRHYYLIAVLMGFALPTAVAWVWGGWSAALGGFLMAGMARLSWSST